MTTPLCTFNELPSGSLAPEFILPSHSGSDLAVPDLKSGGSTLLYFASGLLRGAHRQTSNLLTLADRIEELKAAAVRVVVISRDEYPTGAADEFLARETGISLLIDRDASVGRLYGCHCLEPQFGRISGYDRGPLLCFIDSRRIVRLRVEVTQISSQYPRHRLTGSEIEREHFNSQWGYLPRAIAVEFLVHLGEAARRGESDAEIPGV